MWIKLLNDIIIIQQIGDLVDYLIDITKSQDENAGTRLVECEEANKVSRRIYLYTLFFEVGVEKYRFT